jgi:hypothetical protein
MRFQPGVLDFGAKSRQDESDDKFRAIHFPWFEVSDSPRKSHVSRILKLQWPPRKGQNLAFRTDSGVEIGVLREFSRETETIPQNSKFLSCLNWDFCTSFALKTAHAKRTLRNPGADAIRSPR